MLKIKDEVITNDPIIIFLPKNKGGRVKFDINKVKVEDYPKYKAMGFNIFRCDSCHTDVCFGDCGEKLPKPKLEVEDILEVVSDSILIVPGELNEITSDPIIKVYKSDLLSNTELVEDTIYIVQPELNQDQLDYNSLSLKDLRELFPDIKSNSKEVFISKIPK